MELSLFAILTRNLAAHLKLNGLFQRLQAQLEAVCKGSPTELSDNSNSIARSLAERRALIWSKAANGLDNLDVFLQIEIVGSQMLNHIVEYKETKL